MAPNLRIESGWVHHSPQPKGKVCDFALDDDLRRPAECESQVRSPVVLYVSDLTGFRPFSAQLSTAQPHAQPGGREAEGP